jgi:hypothetical protein
VGWAAGNISQPGQSEAMPREDFAGRPPHAPDRSRPDLDPHSEHKPLHAQQIKQFHEVPVLLQQVPPRSREVSPLAPQV